MGKHFALTLQLPTYQQEVKKQKTKAQPRSGAIKSNIGFYLLLGCAVLTLVYLVQVNSFSTKGYEISKLQKQIDTLRDQNKKIIFDNASTQSMQQIQSDPAISAMVPVTSINYIKTQTLTER